MQRTIALSCLISLVTQPAIAQPQKEVSIALPGSIVSAPPPVSQHAQAPGRRELQDLTRRAYPRTHYQRGQYFLQKGDLNSALIEFLKATQENPRLVRAFYEQALIFEQRGYLKLAESSLQQALAVDPQYQKARVLLATIQLKQGNIGAAVSELSRSLGLAGNAQKARPSQPAEHPPGAPAALPPPSLLQVLHSILPEPPAAEPPPAPQAAQPGIKEDEPTYKLSSPAHEPATDASPEKRTGFAGMPSLPQEVGEKQPKGGLDDILKGIPGIDPDVPVTGEGDREKLTGAGTAGDDKQEKRSRHRKEKRKAPELTAAAAPTYAGQERHSRIHLPNPLSIFRQDPPVERISEPKSPKPSARAERLGQKAEKLKWKAEKLRKKADKLGLKEGKQSENLDGELACVPHATVSGSPDNSAAGVMPAGVAQPKKHGREKSKAKLARKGILSGLFSIFQPEAPSAVSAMREAERQSGSEKKKAQAAGRSESESFGMVVRQPQAQEPLDSQPVSQPTGTVEVASARPAGTRRASGTTIVIPPPPPGSGSAGSPPLMPLSPSYDQAAPNTTPSRQSVTVPQAQANAAAQTSSSNWHGQRFQSPTMPSTRMTWLALTPGQSQANKQASQPAPDEDEWTKRLRYLAEHGTAGLKQGEAFMFSEETGEAVLFMPKGESIRRKVAPPQDPDEVVKARRPDILQPQELQYNLSLLGKLLPHQPEQPSTAPSADKSDPLANFNISDVLRNSNRFWEWLKQSVSF